MTLRPDLGTLALFVRVAETRSITKAAAATHIALAAASRRIAQLEEQYGVQLLYRTARGVELTPAGNALLIHARQMLGQADALRAELSDFTKGGKGLVRVHANTSALAQYLSQDLATFSAAHPAIKIAIEEHRSGAIVQAVQSGATDIGIVMEGAPTGELQCFDYRTDTLVAVLPRNHPLRGKRVAFAKLLPYDIVGLESDTVISSLLAGAAAEAGKPLRLRVQVKGFDVVAKMIQAGLGIGVLPQGAAHSFARPMGLRLVPLTDAWATRRMWVCVRELAALPAPARQLVEHLVAPA
ncbi:MAG: LysR substrate-binding domain-containing protein [Usitatibacter sp.]